MGVKGRKDEVIGEILKETRIISEASRILARRIEQISGQEGLTPTTSTYDMIGKATSMPGEMTLKDLARTDEVSYEDLRTINQYKEVLESIKTQLANVEALNNHLKDRLTAEKEKFLNSDKQLQIMAQQLIDRNRTVEHLSQKINNLVEKLRQTENKENKVADYEKTKQELVTGLKKHIVELEQKMAIIESANDALVVNNHNLQQEKEKLALEVKDYHENHKKKAEEIHEKQKNELKDSYELKIRELIKQHTKQELTSGALIVELKRTIEEQRKIIAEKETAEKELATELASKFNRLIQKGHLSSEIDYPSIYEGTSRKMEEKGIDEVEQILPMVKHGLKNREPKDKIIDSLLNSGYKRERIEKAIQLASR